MERIEDQNARTIITSQGVLETKDPQLCFQKAIAAGRLSDEPRAENYAGKYMYMGTWNGKDEFKHSYTRKYLP